jgi:hypothetical protein
MSEQAADGEMTEAGELHVRLRFIEHDLEHVAHERDQMAAEVARRLRETVKRVTETCNRLDAWLTAEIVTDNGFAEQIGSVVIDDIRQALDGEK